MPSSGPRRPTITGAVLKAFTEDPERRKLVERVEREAAAERAKAKAKRRPKGKGKR